MNIPPIRPKPSEKEISPTSIAGKRGWLSARTVSQSEEGSIIARQKEDNEQKITSDQNKPLAERSMHSPEATNLPTEAKLPILPKDMLRLIAEFSDTQGQVNMGQAAKDLLELAQTADLENLKAYSDTHQLSLKEKIALTFFIQLVAETALTLGDLEEASTIDTSLSPEEALKKLTANYNKIQKAYNDSLQSLSAFAPSASDFLLYSGAPIVIACVETLVVGYPFFFTLSFGIIGLFGTVETLRKTLPTNAATFKATNTAIMSDLLQNLSTT